MNMARLMTTFLLLASAVALAGETGRNSVTFTKKMEMKVEQNTTHCSATASVDYFQRGPEAEIEATIDNPDCAASSGDFVIEVTVRADGADESNKLKFPESWSREDDASVVMTRRYPIGDDTDLLRIKIRKMRCSCATETEPASNP